MCLSCCGGNFGSYVIGGAGLGCCAFTVDGLIECVWGDDWLHAMVNNNFAMLFL